MFNTSLCCCCAETSKYIKIYEFGDKDMKNFKYKDNVYVMNDNLKIQKEVHLYDTDDNEAYLVYEEGKTYIAKAKYVIYKGYYKIESFDTEEKAKAFFEDILKQIEVDKDV